MTDSPRPIVSATRTRSVSSARITSTDAAPATHREWTRVVSVGGSTWGSFDLLSHVPETTRRAFETLLSHTFIAVNEPQRVAPAIATEVVQVLATFRKILQRGRRPPLDPKLERALLEQIGGVHFEPSSIEGDLRFRATLGATHLDAEALLTAAVRTHVSLGAVASPDATLVSARLVHAPAFVCRFGVALTEAIRRSWLPGRDRWLIDLVDPLDVLLTAAPYLLQLLAALDELWCGTIAPTELVLRSNAKVCGWKRSGGIEYEAFEPGEAFDGDAHCTIVLDAAVEPDAALPLYPVPRTIVLRAGTLPMKRRIAHAESTELGTLRNPDAISPALHTVLRWVFAKQGFREGQAEALTQILRGRDCIVLLPTGAGKSLVYQVAGMLLPGRTLVIDPIVALIEDQVESLARAGIDRAVGLSSYVTSDGGGKAALDAIRNADSLFCFVAPERLQQQKFRDALRGLVAHTPINLVVVDEAHCVSEWGHDFRTSYLNLGRNLRTYCATPSGTAPPIVALTGTASRSVLTDLLTELEFDRTQPDLFVKPKSFNRRELSFQVIRTEPELQVRSIPDAVGAVAAHFGHAPEAFVAPRGERSNLGLVFCPWVDGTHGVSTAADFLKSRGYEHVAVYAGKAPKSVSGADWETTKRETVANLRSGAITLLCTTKAFGMGVDIPNIRYTIHLGIPGSIEAFYQEAGRAGRDRKPAVCCVLYSGDTTGRADPRLAADTPLERVQSVANASGNRDDVGRQLFFHTRTFRGRAKDLRDVKTLLARMEWNGEAKQIRVAFSGGTRAGEGQERALHRLSTIGVVRDYTVEHGGRHFAVHLTEAEAADLTRAFLQQVERSQPAQFTLFEDRVRQLAASDLRQHALDLASLSLELLYETIERSRRRALSEMRNLVAVPRTDDEIRTRIEDYFREGELAPRFEALLGATRVAIEDWVEMLRSTTSLDSGELRGTSARLLESFPDHPGLLLTRAYAEAVTGQDAAEFVSSSRRAVDRLVVAGPESVDALGLVFDLMERALRRHGRRWMPMLWEIRLSVIGTADARRLAIRNGLQESALTDAEWVVLLSRLLQQSSFSLRSLLTSPPPLDKTEVKS